MTNIAGYTVDELLRHHTGLLCEETIRSKREHLRSFAKWLSSEEGIQPYRLVGNDQDLGFGVDHFSAWGRFLSDVHAFNSKSVENYFSSLRVVLNLKNLLINESAIKDLRGIFSVQTRKHYTPRGAPPVLTGDVRRGFGPSQQACFLLWCLLGWRGFDFNLLSQDMIKITRTGIDIIMPSSKTQGVMGSILQIFCMCQLWHMHSGEDSRCSVCAVKQYHREGFYRVPDKVQCALKNLNRITMHSIRRTVAIVCMTICRDRGWDIKKHTKVINQRLRWSPASGIKLIKYNSRDHAIYTLAMFPRDIKRICYELLCPSPYHFLLANCWTAQ